MFGGKRAGFTGAAALGVVVMSFVASRGWNTEKVDESANDFIVCQCGMCVIFYL